MSEEMQRKIEQKQRGSPHGLSTQPCGPELPSSSIIHGGWPGILLVQSP